MAFLLKVLAVLVAALVVDRVLLGLEARGWINYRRNGLSLGAARYHVLPGSSTAQSIA